MRFSGVSIGIFDFRFQEISYDFRLQSYEMILRRLEVDKRSWDFGKSSGDFRGLKKYTDESQESGVTEDIPRFKRIFSPGLCWVSYRERFRYFTSITLEIIWSNLITKKYILKTTHVVYLFKFLGVPHTFLHIFFKVCVRELLLEIIHLFLLKYFKRFLQKKVQIYSIFFFHKFL